MLRVAPQPEIRCPRCGYDQRGAMTTWDKKGACPLEGTCTECGLGFDWIDVIDPSRIKPMWCVEYARGRMGLLRSVYKTAAHQAVPWLFWKRVRMHHQPRFGRIAVYLVLSLLTVYAVFMFSQARAAWSEYHQVFVWTPAPPPAPQPPLPPPGLRIISHWHAVAWSAILPFSSVSPGPYLEGGGILRPFPAPMELLERRWADPFYQYDPYGDLYCAGFLTSFWVSLLVFMPLTFALLPQTRRAAKIRWSHIVRIGMYVGAFTAPASWWALFWGMPRIGLPSMLFMSSVNLIWWGFACSRYLHLPRPWFIASLLTFMLLLIGIAAQFYFAYEPFIRHVLGWA